MALTSGTRLGPYEITAQIGAGGMGEVYRATDTNLKRSVAVKVLPESVAGDAERLARFQREAKTISSLNHPHICTLYDVGEHEGSVELSWAGAPTVAGLRLRSVKTKSAKNNRCSWFNPCSCGREQA